MAALAELNRVLPFKRADAVDPAAKQAAFGVPQLVQGGGNAEEDDWAAIEAAAQLEAAEQMEDGEDVDMDVLREIEEQEMAARQNAARQLTAAKSSSSTVQARVTTSGVSGRRMNGRAKMVFEEEEDFGTIADSGFEESATNDGSLGAYAREFFLL